MYEARAIDALTAKVNELARICAHLSRENAELRSQIEALGAIAAPIGDASPGYAHPHAAEPGGPAKHAAAPRFSRRTVGMALVGAAAGLVGGVAIAEQSTHGSGPGLPAGNEAELANTEESGAAAPTASGSILSASLSTASPVLAATNTSTGPGISATSQGRGGIFGGAAAQVHLTPGSGSHPKSGQRGDLYADSAGRLWFCKTTGATATWHQIA